MAFPPMLSISLTAKITGGEAKYAACLLRHTLSGALRQKLDVLRDPCSITGSSGSSGSDSTRYTFTARKVNRNALLTCYRGGSRCHCRMPLVWLSFTRTRQLLPLQLSTFTASSCSFFVPFGFGTRRAQHSEGRSGDNTRMSNSMSTSTSTSMSAVSEDHSNHNLPWTKTSVTYPVFIAEFGPDYFCMFLVK